MTRIEEGDVVDVFFEHLDPIFHARVLSRPCDVGDCWSLEELPYVLRPVGGTAYNVILFAKMTLIEKNKEWQDGAQ